MNDDTRTLAQAFSEKGFATGAFVSAAVLEEQYGLARGFDEYDDAMASDPSGWHFPERSGEETLAAAQAWLSRQEEGPVFLWIHLFEPHRPWQPSTEAGAVHTNPYRGEIWDADRLTADFLQGLDRGGRLDETLVVVSSDHGEGLGEHGEWTHGSLIYDSTMRVPLVIWAGEQTGFSFATSRTVASPVSHVDLAPTLVDLFELNFPESDGVSLVDVLKGEPTIASRTILMESGEPAYLYDAAPLLGWHEESMVWIDTTLPERYSLREDPGQLRNLYDPSADAERLLRSREENDRAMDRLLPSRELSTAESARLAALGYLADPIEELPVEDIKERIPLMAMAQSGGAGFALDEILEQLNTWEEAWGSLEGIRQLRTMVLDTQGKVEESDAYLLSVGAKDLVEARRVSRSEDSSLVLAIKAALEQDPNHPTAHADLALTLWRLGRMEEARIHVEEALRREPTNSQVHRDAMRFFVGLGDFESALRVVDTFEKPAGGLTGDWVCQKARLLRLAERPLEARELLLACRAAGGELGPPELELLSQEAINTPPRAP